MGVLLSVVVLVFTRLVLGLVFFLLLLACVLLLCALLVLAIAGVLAIIPIKASAVINLVLNFMRFPP
ncbi:hypothetical protein NP7_09920 (plasmid) [Moraxella osloensis]|uniref:Uncharacterized protein n=1 Tax=Faucicola osloensis TaxID=34062 RepID=A0A2D2LXD3_FAUOS|nr:hypothetical protein NP7_09920 [Moraxella osloensis]